mgnify:CR=1 FL=1
MNILIVGCGRVGRRLVHVLERLGHDVSVLDEDAANLALLNELEPPFSGMAVAGVPIDGDVLRSAGIEACDAVAAVTKDDNINLMVAQIARELFGVKHVIARVAEPSRKEVYTERFGLRIPYLTMNKKEYLSLVDHLAGLEGLEMDREVLHAKAMEWEIRHAGRTPRVARQFIASLRTP